MHVHDLVDFVTEESFLAGKAAADYVHKAKEKAEDKKEDSVIVQVYPGNRVRYTVPQRLELSKALLESSSDSDDSIRLMYRSTDIYRSVNTCVYSGTEQLAHNKKRIVRPGEMQIIELKKAALEKLIKSPQPITVSIEIPEEAID